MLFWRSYNFYNYFLNKASTSKSSKGPLIKVRFVREQRIFAKGSRGPAKKRTNTLLKFLKLYINSGKLQNLPPLSTILNLYGINVQKLCDDCNIFLKSTFFDDVPLLLQLWITKDLNFVFSISQLRINNLLYSIDTRSIADYFYFNSFFNKRSYYNVEVRKYYKDFENKELGFRDFNFYDLWMFSYFFFLFVFKQDSCLKTMFSYSMESNIRMFLSQLYTYNNLYKFKRFNYLKN